MPGLDGPLLVYDGDCGFCVRWIVRWRRATAGRVDVAPYQALTAPEPEGAAPAWSDARLEDFEPVPRAEFRRSVFLFEPGGRRSRAAEAALRALACAPRTPRGLLFHGASWAYRAVPGVRATAETGYRFVASHRDGLLRLERLLVGDVVSPTWERSRTLFLRGLGLVALLACLSLRVQVDGLAGPSGIAPAEEPLTGGLSLAALCDAGIVLSGLLLCGLLPALCALLLWAAYLTLTASCGPFLHFQWDTLLIETLLVGVFVAPWRWRCGGLSAAGRPPPSALARWLLWWLLFRFMFESGVVKLTSGDPNWRNLSALSYHYLTQPLPHVVGWWAWQLPLRFHELSAAGAFAIELGVPFLILGPRRVRHLACALLVLLQLSIGATGNYGFFNLLSIVLCLTLLDDQALEALGRAPRRLLRLGRPARTEAGRETPEAAAACGAGAAGGAGGALPPYVEPARESFVRRAVIACFAVVVLAIGGLQLRELFAPPVLVTREQWASGVARTLLADGPVAAAAVLEATVAPLLSVNAYGLFRVMTTTRPEILLEASADGATWKPYAFRWKPDDVREPPRWVQPHMPRLDWQLWFEALAWEAAANWHQPYQPSPWFASLLRKLLDGEPAVLALLAEDPFPEGPPRSVRASLSEYRFTTREERARTGDWWIAEPRPSQWVRMTRKE